MSPLLPAPFTPYPSLLVCMLVGRRLTVILAWQVTAEQDQLLKSAFSLLDFDGDGKLGEDEFRTLLRYSNCAVIFFGGGLLLLYTLCTRVQFLNFGRASAFCRLWARLRLAVLFVGEGERCAKMDFFFVIMCCTLRMR